MTEKNLYLILGVHRNAGIDEIKKAYKKIVIENHPDKNNDSVATERFMSATAAYETLSNEEKRIVYDFNLNGTLFDTKLKSTQNDTTSDFIYDEFVKHFKNNANKKNDDVLNHIYDDFMSDSSDMNNIHDFDHDLDHDHDVEEEITITLEESASGCVKEVITKSMIEEVCKKCNGSKCAQGSRFMTCFSCGSNGFTYVGKNSTKLMCIPCKGKGVIPIVQCERCDGTGVTYKKRHLNIRIPIGIDEGCRIRVAGMGAPCYSDDHKGDLYITIRISKNSIFKRDGLDVFVEHHIPLDIAIRGGVSNMINLNGTKVEIPVPEDCEPGKTVVVIPKSGIRSTDSDKIGSLYVTLQVKLPKISSARCNKLLDEFFDELGKVV